MIMNCEFSCGVCAAESPPAYSPAVKGDNAPWCPAVDMCDNVVDRRDFVQCVVSAMFHETKAGNSPDARYVVLQSSGVGVSHHHVVRAREPRTAN